MTRDVLLALAILLGVGLAGCEACGKDGPGGDAADVDADAANSGFCCPIDEPSPDTDCETNCSGCGYADSRCEKTRIYACEGGTWQITATTDPNQSCGLDAGDVDGGSDADATRLDGSLDGADVAD